jgi:hypothetical protein
VNHEGKEVLSEACKDARLWAGRFQTLADAWEHCPRGDWLLWALHKLRHADAARARGKPANEVRAIIGNPFRRTGSRCAFCIAPQDLLTTEEDRFSETAGGVPRCADHLKQIGLELAGIVP